MKKKIIILLVLIFSVFAFSGCGKKEEKALDLEKVKENIQVDQSQKEMINADSEIAGWKEYKNEEYGYSVRYPAEWFFMKDACCPPPPAFVSLNNISEKKIDFTSRQLEKGAWNFDILCLYEGDVNSIGEVKSQKEKGVSNTEVSINGFDAVKFTENIYPGNDKENVLSYYIVDGKKGCRVVYSDKCTVCDRIVSTFKFSK